MGRADDGSTCGLSQGKVKCNQLFRSLVELIKSFWFRYDEALLKYLLLAELGYEVAQSNAAYILDR